MFSKSYITLLAAAVAAVATTGAMAQATVIYSQTFNSSTAPLTGTQPTTDTGGATWTAPFGASYQQNGFIQYQGISALPFTPSAGNTYTLSGNLALAPTSSTPTGYNAGLGFWNTWPSGDNAPMATLAVNGTLTFWATGYPGGGVAAATFDTTNGGTKAALTDLNVTMTLNTAPTNWTVSYSADNGLYSANYTYATGSNPTDIPGVMLYQASNNAPATGLPVTASAFELQQGVPAVPEPGTGAAYLLGVVGLGLLAKKRKVLA